MIAYQRINLLAILLCITIQTYAQLEIAENLEINIQKIYPSFSVDQDEISGLKVISDLNPHFKTEWIKEYYTVQFSAEVKGQMRYAKSKNNIITEEQRSLLNNVDHESKVNISIDYLPDNNLSHNEAKNFSFDAIVEPHRHAKFGTKEADMKKYLNKTIDISKLKQVYKPHAVAVVKFTVNSTGLVTDIQLVESTSSKEVDDMLTQAICNMPDWTPAKYRDGTLTSQDLVLTVGDHNSCTMNLFNIRKDGKPYLAE